MPQETFRHSLEFSTENAIHRQRTLSEEQNFQEGSGKPGSHYHFLCIVLVSLAEFIIYCTGTLSPTAFAEKKKHKSRKKNRMK
jgi:hypothetical protein